MGMFSIDENPAYQDLVDIIEGIRRAVYDKDYTDEEKLFVIRQILFERWD